MAKQGWVSRMVVQGLQLRGAVAQPCPASREHRGSTDSFQAAALRGLAHMFNIWNVQFAAENTSMFAENSDVVFSPGFTKILHKFRPADK